MTRLRGRVPLGQRGMALLVSLVFLLLLTLIGLSSLQNATPVSYTHLTLPTIYSV